MSEWTIEQKDGRTVIRDAEGKTRHSSATPEMLATHFVGAMQELDKRYEQLKSLADALRAARTAADSLGRIANDALSCLKQPMTAIYMDGRPDEKVDVEIA